MNEKSQRNLFNYLLKNGIKNFIGVPDSTLKYFIKEGLNKKKILISTREEEAIGIASGFTLSGHDALVFMQNAGFANSLSTISSLVQMYNFPMIFLIGWRGYLKDDAPEHVKIGKIQPKLIQTLGIKSRILSDSNYVKNTDWAISQLKQNRIVALIIKREFID